MSILVVGSMALDSIKTPFGEREEILGGSATFFSIAASFFNKVEVMATVGKDFPEKYIEILRRRGIGLEGLTIDNGKTFRWKGRYDYNLNAAKTIYTHLNVFKDFKPKVPVRLQCVDTVFLANIDPVLQFDVLKQIRRPRFVACDSMNFWISSKKKQLQKLLPRVDMLLLNDEEARQFSGEYNLIRAAKSITSLGPKFVVIKRGEHGVAYFSKNHYFVAPAYLLDVVRDPTGAGDTFAGGLMGFISKTKKLDERAMRRGIIYGSVLASFAVQDFSVNKLLKISMHDILRRYKHFGKITNF